MTDSKDKFLQAVAKNPDTLYTVYFGTKAAPLTKAHEEIIETLVRQFADKYDNVILRVGVVSSDWKTVGNPFNPYDHASRFHMVQNYIWKTYPDISPRGKTRKVDTVLQSAGIPLYDFLQLNFSNPGSLLVTLGQDEWESLDAGESGGWKKHEEMKRDYMIHCIKPRTDDISATAARNILHKDPICMYDQVSRYLSRWVFDYIKNTGMFWQLAPDYRKEENLFLRSYDASKFERPSVTVDNILWKEVAWRKFAYLIRRGGHPYKGFWALPGGFLDVNQDLTLVDAAMRELKEETGADVANFSGPLKQFRAYGDMGVDPRTRIVDVVFSVPVDGSFTGKAGDDAAEGMWFPVDDLPRMAFNHEQILTEWNNEDD